jgi:hypothetical protein
MNDVRRWGLVVVLVPSIVVVGCRLVRSQRAPRHATLAMSASGPCCEREVVYDLYDAPHRRGER